MSNLAIIPARGGSKRIPRKNIREFLGKPIIAYSIKAAQDSGLFEEIMVSTEDPEIAEIAESYGAVVPFMRSMESASDYATTMDVINEVLSAYKSRFDRIFEFICCIYPAAPLIKTVDLKQGFQLMTEKKYDSVFPVLRFSYPIWLALKREESGVTSMLWPEYQDARTQDLQLAYHDAGQWYWIDTSKLNPKLVSSNSGSVILNETSAQDIDSHEDWKLAEIKYRMLHY